MDCADSDAAIRFRHRRTRRPMAGRCMVEAADMQREPRFLEDTRQQRRPGGRWTPSPTGFLPGTRHGNPFAHFLSKSRNPLSNQRLKVFVLTMSTTGPQHCPGPLWIARAQTTALRSRHPQARPIARLRRDAAPRSAMPAAMTATGTGSVRDAHPLLRRRPCSKRFCPIFKQDQEPPFESTT